MRAEEMAGSVESTQQLSFPQLRNVASATRKSGTGEGFWIIVGNPGRERVPHRACWLIG